MVQQFYCGRRPHLDIQHELQVVIVVMWGFMNVIRLLIKLLPHLLGCLPSFLP
jgi:hypothetical protein